MLGTLDRIEGNLDAARAGAEESLAVAQRLGSGCMQASAELLLGRLSLGAGKAGEAQRYVHDALGRLVAKSFAIDIPECLDVLGAVAAGRESYQEAARLLGAAAAARGQLGVVRFPPEPQFWAGVEHSTRQALGDDGYQVAFTVGTALGIDQAVAHILRTH